jgi:tetratricopeptide (TPR) repeat protein
MDQSMSRFGNLEFGESPRSNAREAARIKDEGFYLSEANSFFEAGRFEQALRSFAKALEQNPKSAPAWTGQVRMLIELGEFKEAKLWAEKALALFPREGDLLAAKAVALARCGDGKAALAFSDASMEVENGTPYVWVARGDVLLARKEKRAGYCFEKALLLARDHWLWPWLASRVHLFYKQTAQALKYAQQALAMDAARAIIWQQLGRCEMALGLEAKAQQSFARAKELDPECPDLERLNLELGKTSFLTRLMRRFSFGGAK